MPNAVVIPFSSAAPAIEAYKKAGGVIEYVLLDTGDSADPHRAAVVGAMAEIRRRRDVWIERRMRETGAKRSQFKRTDVAPENAVGQPITLERFIGRGYDMATKSFVGSWDMNSEGTGSKTSSPHSGYMTDAYADAFIDPPYRMRAELPQLTAWFNAINDALLGDLSDTLDIWSWSTDWSTWFEAGHEWWGSFAWTIRTPSRPWTTAILASATD